MERTCSHDGKRLWSNHLVYCWAGKDDAALKSRGRVNRLRVIAHAGR